MWSVRSLRTQEEEEGGGRRRGRKSRGEEKEGGGRGEEEQGAILVPHNWNNKLELLGHSGGAGLRDRVLPPPPSWNKG